LRGEEGSLDHLSRLCADLGLSNLAGRALLLRGISSVEEGREFISGRLAALPDPFLMPGIEAATVRLASAIAQGEAISVHGDYDVDGITGATLLTEVLRAFGARVDYHIPLRLRDGYGLSAVALRSAAAAGARVVVSVDCGVSAAAEAQLATELGIDLIITDHHQPPAHLPPATAIVHPALPGSAFPFAELAGVGVAFFLLVALRKTLRESGAFTCRPEPDLRRWLDLVALGTIADVVPLKGVNRLLTRAGLAVLAGGERPGIAALKEVAAVREVTCGVVGFRLAPRLNAVGRLEDAALGVDLLLTREQERAKAIAEQLDGFNQERQRIEKETLSQAIERLEAGEGGARTIVLADSRWHSGVIGIVASRLVERYHRPAVLIALADGLGKGSARAIAGFHLYRALQSCAAHLKGFGGHACAAGLTIDEENVSAFATAFEQVAREVLTEEDLLPRILHDGEILFEEITEAKVRELVVLAPFGAGNPEPAYVALGVKISQIKTVGQNHLRFVARQDGYSFPCIAFGMAERMTELQGDIDLLFTPGINEWRDRSSVQLRIRDWRRSADAVDIGAPAPPFASSGAMPAGA